MSSKTPNNPKMAIWEQVKETDKTFTKTATFGGREVTSINGMYMIRRATELFGPLGKGWGYEILVDRLDRGAPIVGKDGLTVLDHEQMHTMQIKFWYVHGGKRNQITHFGHTPYVQKTSWGASTDFDAPKKSLTDAIKKCLSMLGFCADVYLGMYDDATYLEGLSLKKALEEAGESGADQVLAEAKSDFRDWLRSQLTAIDACPNERALMLIAKQLVGTARAKAVVVNVNPDEVEDRINQAAEARRAVLTTPKATAEA